ncbi:MAG: hypothetical protein EBX41_11425, partial [Chitinophagia bacterium]|nr:hypothetical protein [Chitinophagia bacterium]
HYNLGKNTNNLVVRPDQYKLTMLSECVGTHLQQELHQEILDAFEGVLSTRAELFNSASMPLFISSTIDVTNIAVNLNKSGHVDVASDMVDTLLAADNYLKAMAKNGGLVLKGIAKGTLATASSVAKSTAHLLKETGTVAAHLGYAQYNPMEGGKLLYEDGQKMAEAAKRLSRTLSHASLKLYRLLVLLEETGSPDSVGHITSEKEQQNIKEILNIVHAKDIQQFTKDFINAPLEEQSYIVGRGLSEALLAIYAPEAFNVLSKNSCKIIDTSKGLSNVFKDLPKNLDLNKKLNKNFLGNFGAVIERDVVETFGLVHEHGGMAVEEALSALKHYPEAVLADG